MKSQNKQEEILINKKGEVNTSPFLFADINKQEESQKIYLK